MEHQVAKTVRIGCDKICRRLDVLLAWAKLPPVEDIEGSFAPKKALSPSAAAAEAAAAAQAAAEADAAAVATDAEPPSTKKKRGRPPKTIAKQRGGRPPKNQTKNQISTDALPSSSSEDEPPEGTPKETPEDALAEVTAI